MIAKQVLSDLKIIMKDYKILIIDHFFLNTNENKTSRYIHNAIDYLLFLKLKMIKL